MVFPDWIVLYLAIAGGGALILGQRRLGIGLLLPACLLWLAFPLLSPQLQFLPLPLILIAIPVIAVFGGLLLLDKFVSVIYGPHAVGQMTGTFLVRTFYALASALLCLVALLFRQLISPLVF